MPPFFFSLTGEKGRESIFSFSSETNVKVFFFFRRWKKEAEVSFFLSLPPLGDGVFPLPW